MTMKRVLITGGAGFIGSSLALKLLSKNYKVTVLDNLSPQIHGDNPSDSYTLNLIKDKLDFIIGDVTRSEDWDKALRDVNIVVHLAAETGTGQSMYQVQKYVETNINGTAILLDKIVNDKNLAVDRLVVASSRAIYGEGKYECVTHGLVYPVSRKEAHMSQGDFEAKCPICDETVNMLKTDESSMSHPTSVYGYTKKAQEEMSILVGESAGIPVVAFRFQNVYGPGQSLKNPYTGILSIFSTQIKNGSDINIFEDGKEARDFVYIDDVVDAIILGIESKEVGVYNVGSDELTDVSTVAKTLADKYKADVDIKVSGNYRLGDIRSNIADLTAISKDLGYTPKVSFANGISQFVDWVESQEVEEDRYSKSIQEMKEKGLYK
ncbi:NAD-dependent epimerase/dehydratase family protein [Candidatus Saccharibacteria bacterium]|nr:NAD-dependent epimerase/dehydratase family protein [Candidatus Saccharibacteria bacterium]